MILFHIQNVSLQSNSLLEIDFQHSETFLRNGIDYNIFFLT